MKDLPLSLYIHWPWCLKKCPYCDFNSHRAPDTIPEDIYVSCILKSLQSQIYLIDERPIETVYFGGGTPSMIEPASLERLLSGIKKLCRISDDAEITMEANPGTFEQKKFKDFRAAGINRLSVGVQSFDDDRLRTIGRVHNADQAKATLDAAAETFDNFNIDLMFALPGQTLEDIPKELATAFSFAPGHLSYYQLTIEPNTVFATRPPANLPDSDTCAEMLDIIEASTAQEGFDHYEVSAYAKKGRQCRHNLNYWTFGDYIGVGPGAHGKLTVKDKVIRTVSFRDPARWLKETQQGSGLAAENVVKKQDLPFEFMLNALRLRGGVPTELFEKRTGLPFSTIQSTWDALHRRGLVCAPEKELKTTELGWRFLNEVQESFL